jgi:DNA helicase IV
LEKFTPSAHEEVRHNGDDITPVVLRLIRDFIGRGLDVVLLSRRNAIPWYVKYDDPGSSKKISQFLLHIRSFLSEEHGKHVSIETTHRFKGLEKPAVIVLDALQGSYPLIHPNWIFLRIFGDSIESLEDEERRLFYVAATRAKNELVLITETSRMSPFLTDIGHHLSLVQLPWEKYPPLVQKKSRVEIRVSNAFDVREQLKNQSFRWNSEEQYWYKSILADDFSRGLLEKQPWKKDGVRVQIYNEKGDRLKN